MYRVSEFRGFCYGVPVFGVTGGLWFSRFGFSRYGVSRFGVSGMWFRSSGFSRFVVSRMGLRVRSVAIQGFAVRGFRLGISRFRVSGSCFRASGFLHVRGFGLASFEVWRFG